MGKENKNKKTYHFLWQSSGSRVPLLCSTESKPARTDRLGKNLYDGSVEMEVEGEEPLIDQLIIFLQNRTYVWIENMDAKSIPLEHDNGFYER